MKSLPKDWLMWACLGLAGTGGLGLGMLAVRENLSSEEPLWIEQLPSEELPGSISTSTLGGQGTSTERLSAPKQALPPAATRVPQTGPYVASKTGTKYYLPSCATAKRIKDQNKVWFQTKEQAEAAGYQPSSTCKGL